MSGKLWQRVIVINIATLEQVANSCILVGETGNESRVSALSVVVGGVHLFIVT